jgi:hypothetical protein
MDVEGGELYMSLLSRTLGFQPNLQSKKPH